jgi:uncharacterized protein
MRFLAGLLLAGVLFIGYMYSVALRDPIVRRANVVMPDWPHGSPPIRLVLLADIHVGPPDMPPSRLARIVGQVNALDPDLVLIAGDFIGDKLWTASPADVAEAVAGLRRLHAPLGTYAVRGNHDHWRGMEVRVALHNARIELLTNQAAQVGPLSLGGSDDAFTGHDDVPATVAAMRRLPGSRVLLTHSPDVTPSVPDDVSLILAGHTHCGQISFPLIGSLYYESKYGGRFGCGATWDGAKREITSAGLGTSMLPLRLGAAPDMWLITLGPAR